MVFIALRHFKSYIEYSGENGHPCLVPDGSGDALTSSPFIMMLTVGFSHIDSVMFRYASPALASL